jgi:site-specific recombinase XerD
MRMPILNPLLEGYLSYLLEVKRLTPESVRDYRCTLRTVTGYMHQHYGGSELWQVGLDAYIRWMGHERDQGKSTFSISKNISHIRGCLDYAWRNGRVDRNVLDGFTLQDENTRALPRVLSLEEAGHLINVLSSRNRLARRDRMIILLLYGCGLRTRELCELSVQDIDMETREVYVRRGKGGIQRRIPVPDAVWTELLAYLRERGGKQGPLFRTESKKLRISTNDVRAVVRAAVIRAGLSGDITAKTLRHSFATHLMDAGVDLSVISSLMGHKGPTETGVYLHALDKAKQSGIDRFRFGNVSKEEHE